MRLQGCYARSGSLIALCIDRLYASIIEKDLLAAVLFAANQKIPKAALLLWGFNLNFSLFQSSRIYHLYVYKRCLYRQNPNL